MLCRIYQKSGPGPRNGEQYGAPVEEEEDDDRNGLEGEDHPVDSKTSLLENVLDNLHGNHMVSQGENMIKMKPLVTHDNPSGKVIKVKSVFHYWV
mgnify:CR=1 FL=1